MSNKINISDIISGHIKTLCDPNDKAMKSDYFVFYILPIFLALISGFYAFNLSSELISLLVNFGAIFTALLLSVLVLVYDQENKIDSSGEVTSILKLKKKLLKQLYFNISYAIIIAILLVIMCLIHSIFGSFSHMFFYQEEHIFTFNLAEHTITPFIVFIVTNLMLTIVMIVKRMNVILTS